MENRFISLDAFLHSKTTKELDAMLEIFFKDEDVYGNEYAILKILEILQERGTALMDA